MWISSSIPTSSSLPKDNLFTLFCTAHIYINYHVWLIDLTSLRSPFVLLSIFNASFFFFFNRNLLSDPCYFTHILLLTDHPPTMWFFLNWIHFGFYILVSVHGWAQTYTYFSIFRLFATDFHKPLMNILFCCQRRFDQGALGYLRGGWWVLLNPDM